MQLALFSQTPISQVQSQATRVLPHRSAGLEAQASNDDSFDDVGSMWRLVLCVLANVIGGSILLSGMFILPHIIARILS